MEAAIAKLPLTGLPDYRAHCEAAGLIARYCSVAEAAMASVGKEIRDLFTGGDAQWRDLMSDRHGVQCAGTARNDAELASCCAAPQRGKEPPQ
jgi:hypothetical protein